MDSRCGRRIASSTEGAGRVLILGLNAYHGDSAACLVRDGEIVAAAEEERFRRIKHWAGFPSEAIRYCLAEAGASLADVTVVAVNSDPGASFLKKVGYALRSRPDLAPDPRSAAQPGQAAVDRGGARRGVSRARPSRARSSASSTTSRISPRASWCRRFARRPWSPSTASATSRAPPGASAASTAIDVEGRVYFPHSLGVFYQAHDPVSRLPALRRRVQGHGARPLRQARVPGRRCAGSCACARAAASSSTPPTSATTARRSTTPGQGGSPHVGTLFSPALEELLGPARAQGRAAQPTAIAISPAPPRPCTRRRSSISSAHLYTQAPASTA